MDRCFYQWFLLAILFCFCNGQMMNEIRPMLVMKTIVSHLETLKENVDEQLKKLTTMEEMQNAMNDSLKELHTKLLSVEKTQKTMNETLTVQLEENKVCARQEHLEDFQNISESGQKEIMSLLQQSSCSDQLRDFQELLEKDECQDGSHNCSALATCTDSLIMHKCACFPGYTGDGYTCIDIDECSEGDFHCGDNETCVNTPASYDCICQQGYENGFSGCEDIDECQRDLHECGSSAVCFNTNGTYECKEEEEEIPCNGQSLYLEGLGCITPVLTRLSWDDAEAKCTAYGMRLLEGIRKEHLKPLSDHFKPMMSLRPYPWVGFNKQLWISSGVAVSSEVVADAEGSLEGICGNVDLRSSKLGLWDGDCKVKDFSLCQRY